MFAEKRTLTEALRTIPNLTILPSTLYAAMSGGALPAAAVDFGIYQVNGTSEDGASYEVNPQYLMRIWVPATPSDESIQESAAESLHNAVLKAVTEAFYGYQIEIFGIPTGIEQFGPAEAYCVSYTLILGPQIAQFEITS